MKTRAYILLGLLLLFALGACSDPAGPRFPEPPEEEEDPEPDPDDQVGFRVTFTPTPVSV